MPYYNLSEDQEKFIEEAEEHSLNIEYDYSNSFLKGRKCPAVRVKTLKDRSFNTKNLQWDKDDNGFIIYAPF